ncbi:MAG: hypothetical protein J7485_03785 [Sphingobium sp.]|nr:hypothetical protein [Sphingobium sp.]
MSDVAIGLQKTNNPFQAGAVALMLALGIIGFVGLLVLGAYAPDMRSGKNGGGHALSNSATGFSGIVQLARATGRNPRIIRNEHEFGTEGLLVITPEAASVNISAASYDREGGLTLVVLPKWFTQPDPKHPGWVQWRDLLPEWEPIGVMAPGVRFTMNRYRSRGALLVTDAALPSSIRFSAPRPLQVITGLQKPEKPKKGEKPSRPQRQPKLVPLITDGKGGIVLARIGDGPMYVLADPDLLSNRGMADIHQAASALALLDWLNEGSKEGVAFDVSLNGFGHSKSPLKLLFEPPFLALTISVAVALLLAGVQAFGRFGPVRARERAIAFGKKALVDNSAALVRKAGRERIMGKKYAAVVRERAVAIFRIPTHIRDHELDSYLDRLKGGRRFTELAAAAEEAGDRESMLAAAQALHAWQKEKRG